MAQIIKIHDDKLNKDYYMEWSNVCDAPKTRGMSLEEFKKYYKQEYGKSSMEDLRRRLERVEAKGNSDCIGDLEYLFKYNRAGKNESHLDKEAILNNFCRNKK